MEATLFAIAHSYETTLKEAHGRLMSDVESFVRAIYANQALLLINPPSLAYDRQIVMIKS